MQKNLYWTVEVHCPETAYEPVGALAFMHNATGTEQRDTGLLIYFRSRQAAEGFISSVNKIHAELKKAGLTGTIDCSIRPEETRNWNELWRSGLEPLEVGKNLVVLAPWHKYIGDRVGIVIEPGMAFGTGHHATTRVCLELIEELSVQYKDSMIDIGTGTGILAIAARKLGIKRVVAIDIDYEAIRVAKENAEKNHTEDIIFVHGPAYLIKECFSIVVANLTMHKIIENFEDIKKLLSQGGKMVLSGILEEQKQEFKSFLEFKGIKDYKIIKKDKWLGLLL